MLARVSSFCVCDVCTKEQVREKGKERYKGATHYGERDREELKKKDEKRDWVKKEATLGTSVIDLTHW